MTVLIGTIQKRGDIAANWFANNPVLLAREEGVEVDTKRSKIGDGTSHWNDLPYLDEVPIPAIYLKDQDGHVWQLRVDTTGGLYTTFIT